MLQIGFANVERFATLWERMEKIGDGQETIGSIIMDIPLDISEFGEQQPSIAEIVEL